MPVAETVCNEDDYADMPVRVSEDRVSEADDEDDQDDRMDYAV